LILSNIHIGLAAWITGASYFAGNRVSSGGNAYQAIASGTSGTTAPTGTAADFSDGAVHWQYLSAINYTSLSAWQLSIPTTLIDNVVGQIWNDGVITTTSSVPFMVLNRSGGGSPRNVGSYSITLTCAPGESFRDKPNTSWGVTFQLPATGTANYFDLYDSVTFDGLQFISSNTTSVILNGSNSGTTLTVRNCMFQANAQGSGCLMISVNGSLKASNSQFLDKTSSSSGGVVIHGSDYDSFALTSVVNCTIVRINAASGSATAVYCATASMMRNSVICGYSNTLIVGGTGSGTVDHSVMTTSSVGNGTNGGNNVFGISAGIFSSPFVQFPTDLRLNPASVCVGAGAVDTIDIPSATDMLGYPRSSILGWSVGALEFTGQMVGSANIGTIQTIASSVLSTNASSTRSIGTIVTNVVAKQENPISATVTIGSFSASGVGGQINVLTSQAQIGLLSASGTIGVTTNFAATLTTIGQISANGIAGNVDLISGLIRIASITGSASLNFEIITTALITIPISVSIPLNPMNAVGTVGGLSASGVGGQSDRLAAAVLIGPVTASATFMNAYTARATVGIGALSTLGILNQVVIATATASLVIVCRASDVALGFASPNIGAISSVVTLTNPLPANARVSIIITPLVAFKQSAIITAIITLHPQTFAGIYNAPRLRVSQLPTEVLVSGGRLRISQLPTEILISGGRLRVSQTAIEILALSPPNSMGRVSQVVGEVLMTGTPLALVSQTVQEVLIGGIGNQNVRVSQILIGVLVGGSTTQNVLMSQVVMAVLIPAIPLIPSTTTTFFG
jgi:hypothetical protein